MAKKYKVKKDKSFAVFLILLDLLILFTAFLLPIILNKNLNTRYFFIQSIILITLHLFFLWIWFFTYYIIKNSTLIIYFGPIRWKILIGEITKIRLNQRTIGGLWKATLSWKCIEIRYGKYGTISVSPIEELSFLKDITNQNENILLR